MELAWGEPSPSCYIAELQIHADRLRMALDGLRNVVGPNGWRQRIEIRRLATIDTGAIVRTARQLMRSMERLNDRLPTDHLQAVIAKYQADVPGLFAIRDMAAHLDEDAVGKGRADAQSEQPGPVFEYEFTADDVVVTARTYRASALEVVAGAVRMAPCIDSSIDAHLVHIMYPDGWDFDYVAQQENGSFAFVPRESEDPDQRSFRDNSDKSRAARFPAVSTELICPECGQVC